MRIITLGRRFLFRSLLGFAHGSFGLFGLVVLLLPHRAFAMPKAHSCFIQTLEHHEILPE